ncbi:MAG: aa3-type cytochrome c oxidase subunit IV [Erythrobacter sp.]
MASQDIETAQRTYGSFIGMLKWAVPVIAVITLVVIMLIAE